MGALTGSYENEFLRICDSFDCVYCLSVLEHCDEPGVLGARSHRMDYNFRAHIASTARLLRDAGALILSDRDIAQMRDRGELILHCVVDAADYYFTAVGWVVVK